jgi:hypothetical protein
VFLRYYTEVERSFEEAEIEFLKRPDSWLPDAALHANGHGIDVLSELGFKVGKQRIGRAIEITLGDPMRGNGFTLVPLQWKAADTSSLFPKLDGHIEIARIGPTSTQLGISATYEPPFGIVGQTADRALFHRVAEMTVKDFLERIAAKMSA